MNFGSAALQAKIIPDVLAGRKFISLAISEAFAGSDVQKIRFGDCTFILMPVLMAPLARCTATKTPDGKFYIVNGTKVGSPFLGSHISLTPRCIEMDYQVGVIFLSPQCSLTQYTPISGHFSDYFSTAVNTGKGLSMLLIERGDGVRFVALRSIRRQGLKVCQYLGRDEEHQVLVLLRCRK